MLSVHIFAVLCNIPTHLCGVNDSNHMYTGAQAPGPSSGAFWGHWQGPISEAELLRCTLASKWDVRAKCIGLTCIA